MLSTHSTLHYHHNHRRLLMHIHVHVIVLLLLIFVSESSSAEKLNEASSSCVDDDSNNAGWRDIWGNDCAWYDDEHYSDYDTNTALTLQLNHRDASSSRCDAFGHRGGANVACCHCRNKINDTGFTSSSFTATATATTTKIHQTKNPKIENEQEKFNSWIPKTNQIKASKKQLPLASSSSLARTDDNNQRRKLDEEEHSSNNNNDNNNNCINVVGWVDLMYNNCTYYEQEESTSTISNTMNMDNTTQLCNFGASLGSNQGYTTATACCACGGGFYPAHQLIYPEAVNVPLRPITDPVNAIITEGEPCLDRPNWSANIGNVSVTCAEFHFHGSNPLTSAANIADRLSCDQFGHVEGTMGSNARDSCCICGGGYNGTLIGRTLRVSFPRDSDAKYSLYTNITLNDDTGGDNYNNHGENDEFKNNGNNRYNYERDGSIVQFMKEVASASGFGMYETNISDIAREEHPQNSYEACLLDVEIGNTDICIGPFWKYYESDSFSNALFQDEFYLVIPKNEGSNLELLLTPVMPFTWDAWIWIALTCFYMGYVVNLISSDTRKMPCCKRVGAIVYNSIKSCAAADVFSSTDKNPSTGEKVVVSGFVIFALIVLTAYTATSAAFLVSIGKNYRNLDEVISSSKAHGVCVSEMVYDVVLEQHPHAVSVLNGVPGSSSEILDMIQTNDENNIDCYGAIVPADSFIYYIAKNSALCSKLNILLNEAVITVDNIIPSYPLLGETGQELLQQINALIDEGIHLNLLKYFEDFLEQNPIDGNGEDDDVLPASPNESDLTPHRFLKGGKAKKASSGSAASGSNTASKYNVAACGDENEVDLDKFQLDYFHLLMPISLSLFCSTLGLSLHLFKRFCKSTRVQKELLDIQQTMNLNLLLPKNNSREEERVLRQELRDAPAFDLIRFLQTDAHLSLVSDDNNNNSSTRVDCSVRYTQKDLEAAIDALPDKTRLIELVFAHRCSEERRDFYTICLLNITELCKVIRCYSESIVHNPSSSGSTDVVEEDMNIDIEMNDLDIEGSKLDQSSHEKDMQNATTPPGALPKSKSTCKVLYPAVIAALNRSEDPKRALIDEVVMKQSMLRRMALHCARMKRNAMMDCDDSLFVFDVRSCLYNNDEKKADGSSTNNTIMGDDKAGNGTSVGDHRLKLKHNSPAAPPTNDEGKALLSSQQRNLPLSSKSSRLQRTNRTGGDNDDLVGVMTNEDVEQALYSMNRENLKSRRRMRLTSIA